MKIYQFIRTIVYTLLGLAFVVFAEQMMFGEGKLLPVIVSFNMLLVGVEGLTIILISKKVKKDMLDFVSHIISIVLGLIVLCVLSFLNEPIVMVCYFWGAWAIFREVLEVIHLFKHAKHYPVCTVLNLIESIVIVIFSILLILEPGEHHALTHVVILGVELLLEVIWKYLYKEEESFRTSK